MSFAFDVKAELAQVANRNDCCRLAQTYGMLELGHHFTGADITLQTENPAVAELYCEQIRAVCGVDKPAVQEYPRKKDYYIVRVPITDCRRVLEQFGHTVDDLTVRLNRANLDCDNCAAAYLRGAFLVAGSVTNPQTDYHLEFSVPYYHLSRDLLSLLAECGLNAKVVTRKGNYIVYLKDSEQVEDCLTLMGATASSLELMSVKMVKDIRNRTNRMVNCENANMDKTVAAATTHMQAVRKLMDAGVLENLSPELQEAARLRYDNPEASLRELCEMFAEPVSRSGMNHRLRRLVELADQLK
ncbi:MAG: DNA-binding protein WhiA [Clostridia bacterium]|nr:DNA-binding protein WhiA [Clostridia bacterium]